MEQKLKQMSADEKRLLRHIKDKHDSDMKMFLSDQKAAYKAAKNQFKKVCSPALTSIPGDVEFSFPSTKLCGLCIGKVMTWGRCHRVCAGFESCWLVIVWLASRPFQNTWSHFASASHRMYIVSLLLTNQSACFIFHCRTRATVHPIKEGKTRYTPPRKMLSEKRCMNMTLCAMLNSESFAENNSCNGRT